MFENLAVIYVSMGTTIELIGSQVMAITNGVLSTTYSALSSLRGTVLQDLVYRIAVYRNKHRFFLADCMVTSAKCYTTQVFSNGNSSR